MTFSALFLAIEFINRNYDNKLLQIAQQENSKYEFLLNQLVTESFLSKKLNKQFISSNSLYQASSLITNLSINFDKKTSSLNLLSTPSNESYSFDNTLFKHLTSYKLSSLYFLNNGVLTQINGSTSLFDKVLNFSTDESSPSKVFSNVNYDGNTYSSFLFQHSVFKSLYINTLVPNSDIYRHRNIMMFLIISIILLINIVTIFVYTVILKRITESLSQITENAKKISKGQITSPIKVMSNDEIGLLAQSFNNMLNNVQTKTAELIHEKNRSKMIVTQLPDGVIVTDLENKLVMANRTAELMLDFSLDHAQGQEIVKFLKHESLQSLFKSQIKFIKDNSIVRDITINVNNQVQFFQIIISPLLDTSYQKNGIITVLRNVTHERKMQSLKDSFLRTVTHELKTPLTSIIGFLDIILKESHGTLNPKQKDFLSISILNSKYLKKLINDLLELSSIHSGQSKMTYEKFQLKPLIEQLLKNYHPIIQNKKNIITVNYQDSNIEIYADKDKIKKIIENLIINANKFTEDGIIDCFVNQTSSFTSFVFKDSGMGMSEDQRNRLLQALDKKNTTDFTFDGINLELSLVKELTSLHNGEIFVETEESNGSVFTIMVPHLTTNDIPTMNKKTPINVSS